MTTPTYNLNFTISHTDNLQFEVNAESQEQAIQLGIDMIRNQMDDFNSDYDIALNDVSAVNNYTPLSPTPVDSSSTTYNSLANHYSATQSSPTTSSQTELPPLPGYTRLVN